MGGSSKPGTNSLTPSASASALSTASASIFASVDARFNSSSSFRCCWAACCVFTSFWSTIITVQNSGSGSPSGVKVIDRLPDGFEYVSDDAPATGDTYDPATGLWFVDEILAGTSETLTITARLRETGETSTSLTQK